MQQITRTRLRLASRGCLGLVLAWAVIAIPSSAWAQHVTHAYAAGDTSWTVGPGSTNVNLADAGSVSGKATARVVVGGPLVVQTFGPVPKAPNLSITSPVATATGTTPPAPFTTATSQAAAQIGTPNAFGMGIVGLTTTGTFAKINPIGKDTGYATALVDDPVTYSNTSGQPIHLTYGLGSGFAIGSFAAPGTTGYEASQFMAVAGSDIPGLTSLFTLEISTTTLEPGNVSVDFVSNPLLGLNDAAIDSLILGNLTLDASTGDYVTSGAFNYVDTTVTVPVGQDTASFSYDASVAAQGGVPEPTSIVLGIIGLFTCLVVHRFHGRRRVTQKLNLTLEAV